MKVEWSDEEKAILRERWKVPGDLKTVVLPYLPGRSYSSITHMREVLSLPKRPTRLPAVSAVWRYVEKLLRASPGMDINELARRTGSHPSHISHMINAAHRAGEVYISGWVRYCNSGYWARQWSMGNHRDADRPLPMTRQQRLQRDREFRKTEANDLVNARRRLKRQEMQGKLVRRDPMVAAFFGEAA